MNRALMLCVCWLAGCGGSPAARSPAPEQPRPEAAAAPSSAADSWRAKKPEPGAPGEVRYPIPEITRLDNGFTIIVVPRPAAIVHVSVVSRHGASSVPRGKSGLAALTARMLAEGTQTKSSLALAEATESLGAVLSSDAGRDSMQLWLEVSKDDLKPGLSLLAEVVTAPGLRRDDFERVRAEWLDGLIAERQSPGRLASLVGLRSLLGADRGAPVGGSIPDVKKMTVADLRRFHQRAFAPSELALVLCGDVSTAAVRDTVTRLFAKVTPRPKAQVVATAAAAPTPSSRILVVDRPGSVQTALFVAQHFPERRAAGHEAREVMNNLLGGLFTSRINQNLREQHAFTYGARSTLAATRDWGAFVVATSVKTEVTAKALEQLLFELKAMKEPALAKPLTEAELARSKADLSHSLGAHLEHVSRMSSDMHELFAHELQPDHFAVWPKRIAAMDAAHVSAEAARLDPAHLVVVAVGDRARMETDLQRLGLPLEAAPPELLE